VRSLSSSSSSSPVGRFCSDECERGGRGKCECVNVLSFVEWKTEKGSKEGPALKAFACFAAWWRGRVLHEGGREGGRTARECVMCLL